MPRLGQIAKSDDNPKIVRRMYRALFGDRDPVAEPGTATGTPGDWWTVWANSPDVLVHVLEESGVDTGIDLDALIGAARLACDLVGRPVESHLGKAGPRFRPRPEPA